MWLISKMIRRLIKKELKAAVREYKEESLGGMEHGLGLGADPGLSEKYLIDIRGSYAGGTRALMYGNQGTPSRPSGQTGEEPVRKIPVRPIDVLHELEKVPTPFGMEGLDAKIEILKLKMDLVVQLYASKDLSGVIQRLENRKKYPEFREFYEQYQNTTRQSVDALLEKHGLELHTADLFIPDFPEEAVIAMQDYMNKTLELCGVKPVFYVIAPPDLFKKVYEKRGPILLAQSPFGMYWQILGAWDDEMLILGEL